MRAPGEFRTALRSALEVGPAHPAAIAQHHNLDVRRVRTTLADMCRAGQAVVLGEERVPWANRPVRVYGLVTEQQADAEATHNWDLIKCWSAWPADL